MDTPFVRRSLGVVAALLVLLVLALWFWPRNPTREVGRAAPRTAPPQPTATVAVGSSPGTTLAPGEKEPRTYTLEDFPDLADAPPNCQQIVLSVRRKVPAWSIEKNMDAQAMMFDDAEMACLNEKGVPDQILDRAEHHRKFPQPTNR